MRAAGGAVNLDIVSKKPSVNDGKSRLFGMGDENTYNGGEALPPKNSGGKRILHASNNTNTYGNVIGGSYSVEDAKRAQQLP